MELVDMIIGLLILAAIVSDLVGYKKGEIIWHVRARIIELMVLILELFKFFQ